MTANKPTGRVEGNNLILTRIFRASIEDVWTNITDSDSTARWYGSWRGTPGVGNIVTVQMLFEADGTELTMTIEACDAPHRLVLTSDGPYGVHLDITLTHNDGVTELQFIHRGQMPVFSDYHPKLQDHFTVS